MRRWIILIIIIALGGAIWWGWVAQKNDSIVAKIMDSAQYIDSITVKDGKTKEEILGFTKLDSVFPDMVEVYKQPYRQLVRSEKNLLQGEPFLEVEYLQNNEIKFIVSIYQLDNEQRSTLVNTNDTVPDRHMYSPKGNNTTYIFAIKENNQLLGVNEGFKEVLDLISSR